MNGELLAVFEYLEREKGISRDILVEAVTSMLVSAERKRYGVERNLIIEIDKETGNIKASYGVTVVEKVSSPVEEISLAAARKINPEAKTGDTVRRDIPAKSLGKSLGRIAAQTGKQVFIQRIREAENEIIFNEYKGRVGEVITAVVRRYERGNIILDLGRAEAILPPKEQCPREGYGVGRRFKVYIVDVREGPKGPEIIVSRSHIELLRKLFEIEVPEINEKIVEIKAVARDPGFRSKIAVVSTAEKVDAVGACVGMRGARVKDVVRELNGEKVDIVRWSENSEDYITNALSPAKLKQVKLDKEQHIAEIVIDDDQFSLAVGRKGQGARLVARLTGWKINMKKVSEVERDEQEVKVSIEQIPGLSDKVRAVLKENGYGNLGALRGASAADLLALPGIGEKTAEKIMQAVAEFRLVEEKREDSEEKQTPGKPEAAAAPGDVPEKPGEAGGDVGEESGRESSEETDSREASPPPADETERERKEESADEQEGMPAGSPRSSEDS